MARSSPLEHLLVAVGVAEGEDRAASDLEQDLGTRPAEPIETDSNDEPAADANGDSDDERPDENQAVPDRS